MLEREHALLTPQNKKYMNMEKLNIADMIAQKFYSIFMFQQQFFSFLLFCKKTEIFMYELRPYRIT